MRPSLVSLPASLAPRSTPHFLRRSLALPLSPLASVRAFLHSMTPALVSCRSSLTSLASIDMGLCSCGGRGGGRGGSLGTGRRRRARAAAGHRGTPGPAALSNVDRALPLRQGHAHGAGLADVFGP